MFLSDCEKLTRLWAGLLRNMCECVCVWYSCTVSCVAASDICRTRYVTVAGIIDGVWSGSHQHTHLPNHVCGREILERRASIDTPTPNHHRSLLFFSRNTNPIRMFTETRVRTLSFLAHNIMVHTSRSRTRMFAVSLITNYPLLLI